MVCRLLRIPAHRIWYYDAQGLLGELERRGGNAEGERLFSAEQIERLCAVDRWTAAGWSLEVIRSVLGSVGSLPIDEHIQGVAREIHEKTAMLEELQRYSCDPAGWRASVRTYQDLLADAEERIGPLAPTVHRRRNVRPRPRGASTGDPVGRTGLYSRSHILR